MNFMKELKLHDSQITLNNHLSKIGEKTIINNLLNGLNSNPKHISSMFFYDETGSKLFEEITRLEEYYLTRIEKKLIRRAANQINKHLKEIDIIELGSGDPSKISLVLDVINQNHIKSIQYIPIDISKSAIEESAEILINHFPDLEIKGMVADFTKQLSLIPKGDKRLFCFFGSTIGNFTRIEANQFFLKLGVIMHQDDMLLLGVDRIKNKEVLEKAYNDSKDITAKFNKNILNVVNRLIKTNFNPDLFEHVAFYNEKLERIEMHLKALVNQEISCPYQKDSIIIREGEIIHTENSHKFSQKHIENLALTANLTIRDIFSDNNNWFSLIHFTKG